MLTESTVVRPFHFDEMIIRRARRSVPASWLVLKRITDCTIAAAVLVLTAPILGIAIAAIAVSSGGSPFFRQQRVGKNGRTFTLYKLRTMIPGAHAKREMLLSLSEASGPIFKIKNDPRVTPVGRILRKTSIDELPNLFNVLLGDMSLVGPRPPLPEEVAHYDEYALRRLTVQPGITCLWQISGRSTITDFNEWMRLGQRIHRFVEPALRSRDPL